MYETDNDIRRLQELLDRTVMRANPHRGEGVVVLEGTPTLLRDLKLASAEFPVARRP